MVQVDLITGFLGSGKTTFIKKYAKYLIDQGLHIAILENDFGAINVDMMVLEEELGDQCELEMVVGGGDSAVEEAIFLTQFAKSVTIVHRRDALRAQKVLQDRAFANEKIHFAWNTVVQEIKGDNRVTSLVLKDVQTGEVREQAAGGVFIYVGLDPVSDFAKDLGILDDQGWVITDDHMKTSVPGVFAVGDVRQKDLRQVTTAVGDGAVAGQEAYKYITEHEE